MGIERLLNSRGIIVALVLAIAAAWVGYLCVRAAIVQAVPVTSASVAQIAPRDPDVILGPAVTALVEQRGILDTATLNDVRRAAQRAPLDARPFLILGHQQLLDGQADRALATLEAAQLRDPRDRVVHLLLLDRYLRTGRYSEAAAQFSVSSRLVGPAQGAIANAMAQMSLAPETRDAVRRTLAADPALESDVLVALARSDAAPTTIFALASPAARRDAGAPQGWGPVLVNRLIDKGHYAAARSVWQRVYGLSPQQTATPVFDASFQQVPGSSPFNWTLVANSLGAADIRGGTLSINYYGRDNGDLAQQLLVLRPGRYRFTITAEGSKTGTGPSLIWSLRCKTGGTGDLMTLPVVTTGGPHRNTADFVVPANCPAQQLTLSGAAGEFPTPINLSLRDLDLRTVAAAGAPK
ncbi:hypothetical protein ASG11_08915 [Sphingomonas sp. Leaf357]|uniref:tetratricopeptide repeat protein n=1 Tax=Sphingomonas sp. Leaf357 TaxID=1736350 RepID=UPI0006F59853|nr:hypothetical protein [Sphingomonas sp. Leaf357]KQS04357.1 hypothetical protein ASG11_08915 [Sphingomonas sp. Leaf357]